MDSYPSFANYEILYKRFLINRQPRDLFKIAYPNEKEGSLLEHKHIIDVCSGFGRLTRQALGEGADLILAIEKDENMIKYENYNNFHVKLKMTSIENYLPLRLYDAAFCQQAINYWFSERNIIKIYNSLIEKGIFVFNTFNKKPCEKPTTKEYVIDNVNYLEVNYVVGDDVYHYQGCDGIEPHLTKFKWISPEQFDNVLSKYFNVEVIDDKGTSIYRCVKKGY